MSDGRARWLLLIHQIPPKPDYFRVKVRRRLQRMKAVALKNSVYVLPLTEESREDFEWLAREIESDGGEAMVCEATFVRGVSDEELESMFEESEARVERAAGADRVEPGRTWVTRSNVHVDRMASAWLIRRFIDREAKFRFVSSRTRPAEGEIRFDMYEGEYTHEGDRCTFEVLLERFGLRDRGLRRLSEIVHEIDLKDEKYGRPESAGIALLVNGIVASTADDAERLERSRPLWEDLYTELGRQRG
jgi:hypothetical protein